MPRFWLLGASLCCALVMSASPSFAAEPWVPAAHRLQVQHRFEAAESLLQGVLKRDPDDLAANLQMALLEADQLRPDQALVYLKRTAAAHPDSFEAQVLLIHGYLWANRDEDALREANRILQAFGNKAAEAYWKAMLYAGLAGAQGLRAERGGLVAALQHGLAVRGSLEKALSFDPDCVIANYAMGRYFLQAPPMVGGDPAKGMTLIEKAAKLDPRDHQIQAFLIRILASSNRSTEARERWARYRETFKGHPAAMKAMADLADKL